MNIVRRLRRNWESFLPPVLGGNSFRILAGGPSWYAHQLSAIRKARREILLQSYLWDDDATSRKFLVEAAHAAQRGVRVRIIMDGYGSLIMHSAAWQDLVRKGGEVGIYNPIRFTFRVYRLFRRNHRKLAVFDGNTGFIGGFGYSDKWAARPPAGWWDIGVKVRGPVASQFRDVFIRDWMRCRKPAWPGGAEAPVPHSGKERLRLLSSTFGRRILFRSLRREIMSARERVFICTTYFIPTARIRRALRKAARRGVDVRLLLPTPLRENVVFRFAGRRHYGSLLAAGVRIFEYMPAFLHAKYALTDRKWALVGSSNLDSLSGWVNLEADMEVRSPRAVGDLAERFRRDSRASREITRDRWSRRPWWTRMLERLLGYFDHWL